MGQAQSNEHGAQLSSEQLSHKLAHRFADKCFTPLELTHFKDIFRTLADEQDGIQYWKEESLCRFLALPDALAVGPVVYQMSGYLGAFPFPTLAPAILTREALVKVVVIMTERYAKVLKGGGRDRIKLLFRSMAVFDRRMSSISSPLTKEKLPALKSDGASTSEAALDSPRSHVLGFSIDEPGGEDDYEDEGDDELALAALDSLDAIEVYRVEHTPSEKLNQAQIPVDNFRRLVMLLLVISTLESQDNLSKLASYLTDTRMTAIQRIANSIIWTFAPEHNAGIAYSAFNTIIHNSLPYIFDGFNPLFEHFLFSKNLNLAKHKANSTGQPSSPPPPDLQRHPLSEPVLQKEGEILDLITLSQLSFFIKSSSIFYRLRLLYSGSEAGFSINSITQKILNWRAPTIILVAGSRLPAAPSSARERAFAHSLDSKRFPDSGTGGDQRSSRLVFGAYLNVPWKETHKEAIGDERSLLFQLEPLHEVFRASTVNRDYATLGRGGLGFGVPPAKSAVSGRDARPALGAVSLLLDERLEYGVFTHDAAGGGAFATSKARGTDWQDRFEVESLEVWGCGGDQEAESQRQAWRWEEREAAARRGVALGKDRDADYALLEMAGLVGGHGNSGGSMG